MILPVTDTDPHVTTISVVAAELPTGDSVWTATEEATGRKVASLISAHSAVWHMGRKVAGLHRRIVEQCIIAEAPNFKTYRVRVE